MNKNIKKRNWAFVLYPESAPSNWRDQLQQTGLPVAISPLHDMDIDPTGEIKKAHYHIILCYEGPTSFNVVSSITSSLNCPIPIPLEQVKGYYRYFTHRDNPEKYQYDLNLITTINGFSVNDYVGMTEEEVDLCLLQLQELIEDKNILEYSSLMNILKRPDTMELWKVARRQTLFLNSYIKSRRYKSIQDNSKVFYSKK